jgi:hypothetical protein
MWIYRDEAIPVNGSRWQTNDCQMGFHLQSGLTAERKKHFPHNLACIAFGLPIYFTHING